MRIAAGTLKPDLEAVLADRTSTLDLTTATGFRVVAEQAGQTLFTDEAPTVDTDALKVTHEWVGPIGDAAGETDHRGRGFWYVEVDFGDGKWIRFPSLGDLVFDID